MPALTSEVLHPPPGAGDQDLPRGRAWELLVLCARSELSRSGAERVAALIREGVSWPELLALARRHRVVPFLLRHLAALPVPEVPADLLRELRTEVALNAAHSRVLVKALREILLHLEARGIAGLPYKGPVLAHQLYGDVAFRQMTDLDVLVRPDDLPRALDVLQGLGYRPRDRLSPRQQRALLRANNNLPLHGGAGRVSVELHWAFATRHPIASLDLDALRPATRSLRMAGMAVPTFGTEDLLLVLCFHGARHLWERLAWLCDVAELVRSHEIDWDQAISRAERFRSRRVLFLGLRLAQELLDAPLPDRIADRVRSDCGALRLCHEARAWIGAEDDRPAHSRGLPFHRFQLRALDGLGGRARYLWRALWTPTPEDWQALPLPDPLFPLYYLLRPLRLTTSYGLLPRSSHRTTTGARSGAPENPPTAAGTSVLAVPPQAREDS